MARVSSAKKTVTMPDFVYLWIVKHMQLTGENNFSKAMATLIHNSLLATYGEAYKLEAQELGGQKWEA